MPEISVLDNLGVSGPGALLYVALSFTVSALVCLVLYKRLNEPIQVILLGILCWVLPFVGPAAALIYVMVVERASRTSNRVERRC